MVETFVTHGTVVAEQVIKVSVARAYAAFANVKERESWAAPSDTAVFIYDEVDFRVGGRDMARCGDKNDPKFRVETRYVDIKPEQYVVSVETINELSTLLATNITTIEFLPEGKATRLKVSVQVVSFVGNGMIENTKSGHQGSLANMARYLERPKS
jgi:uncharacterized protein YndB with AHSA1/START domain